MCEIPTVPDGYLLKTCGTAEKGDLNFSLLTGCWQPIHTSEFGKEIGREVGDHFKFIARKKV